MLAAKSSLKEDTGEDGSCFVTVIIVFTNKLKRPRVQVIGLGVCVRKVLQDLRYASANRNEEEKNKGEKLRRSAVGLMSSDLKFGCRNNVKWLNESGIVKECAKEMDVEKNKKSPL